MTVITRFAPSPTGYLHIGGARTALFNWLFARHYGGKFLLRIEDTDRARSTDDAIQAIFKGLQWLGLDWDDEPTFQFSRAHRHIEVAEAMIKAGKAYYCYCSPEELEQMKQQAVAEGRAPIYDGRWRDRDPAEAPKGVRPVIRIKMPKDGETVIHDTVQGQVTVQNAQLDDMILVRSDGTPTYMLAVVVDDHDMGVTHIIRGDDHLTNAFRQKQIYEAMGWHTPSFSHIPLIHGQDGAKLSKRHGALGVDAYEAMGFLPEAMRNYLVRLSWAHGDDEIFSTQQAIEWFDGSSIGKSAARFDMVKSTSVNGHYIQDASNQRLVDLLTASHPDLTFVQKERMLLGMNGLKQRAKTLVELWESAQLYVCDIPVAYTEKAKPFLANKSLLGQIWDSLSQVSDWHEPSLHEWAKAFAETHSMKLGDVAQPIRAALTGSTVSPSVFEVAAIIGCELTEKRFQHALKLSD
ncbi:MAG: glutamate--tRNA ligase [Alphaproteobacteria bacterium]|nr:glutamate--tRNA ligase [Alphaproteobacteria bacterium]